MKDETPAAVLDWANATFGPVTSLEAASNRIAEEFAELQVEIEDVENTAGDARQTAVAHAANEFADVIICMWRLATHLGIDVQDAINRKMAVNRGRVWVRDGLGQGHHVRTDAVVGPPGMVAGVAMGGTIQAGTAYLVGSGGVELFAGRRVRYEVWSVPTELGVKTFGWIESRVSPPADRCIAEEVAAQERSDSPSDDSDYRTIVIREVK